MLSASRTVSIVAALSFLTGCGLSVPRLGEVWDRDIPGDKERDEPVIPVTSSGQVEYAIKKNVYCQLLDAVKEADAYGDNTIYKGEKVRQKLLPDDWGAQVSLSIQVDENIALNPGVAFNTVLPNAVTAFPANPSVTTPQNSAVALGGTLSSAASRTDKFNSFWTIGYLRNPNAVRRFCKDETKDPLATDPSGIRPAKSSFLADELGITSWLLDALFVSKIIPSYGTPSIASDIELSGNSKKTEKKAATGKFEPQGQDTFSIQIKFVVISSGNVTPSWRLVRVSANTGSSPFLGAGRTRTHDLILTIGPRSLQTNNANLALQIGQAVSSNNRSSFFSQ